MTKQLLAFSRQQVLERRVIDLVGAVSELQPMIERLIGEDVQFSFNHAEPPQLVLIDPGQFEQIVMNLVINARDAMPARRPPDAVPRSHAARRRCTPPSSRSRPANT